jgi:Phosphodiester glycosidase
MSLRTRCSLWLALGLALFARFACGAQIVSDPFLGVRHIRQTETSPRPLQINVVEIDLSAPGLRFQVSPGGAHPRPLGTNGQPMETVRQTSRQFANAISAQIAINGSFYASQTIGGALWANNLGLTTSNGERYSPWELPSSPNFDDALNITQSNQAAIVKMPASIPTGFETNPPVTLYNTVTGSHRIVTAGANVAPPPGSDNLTLVHPRTAVGVTANNKLLLMTVDGRQPGFSEGVNLQELANLMLSHGAKDAINLDGGGSTQMVMNYYGDALAAQVLNTPSDGSERSVGTNLAVFALPNGDYNQDGRVEAADYVVWRKPIGSQFAYDAWRQRFGAVAGSNPGQGAAIPEPATCILAALAALAMLAKTSPTRPERHGQPR